MVAIFKGTEARYMVYEDGLLVLARALVADGYKREAQQREEGPDA